MTSWGALLIALICLVNFGVCFGFSPGAATRAAFLASSSRLHSSGGGNFYNDFEDLEDDDDDYIDTDQLGDWRRFRLNLAQTGSPSPTAQTMRKSVSKENEEVLRSQCQSLAEEYETGVWAHETSRPELGGLVLRMPLEVEIYRNTEHSMIGKKLRESVSEGDRLAMWYRKAQILCENEMRKIASMAVDGQIDASKLDDESSEFLQLYLDNQETWQEVCLVVEHDEEQGKGELLVLNRPMAFKLTANLAQLVLQGSPTNKAKSCPSLEKFMKAFGQECAIYVGGPDEQYQPAAVIHGFKELPGAREVSPGSNIYMGGMEAVVQGVIDGKYKPLDFRFFIGRHRLNDNLLELECLLGKYQPVACARPLALKQCISLPKPLWHEVLELCGGELQMISQLEILKRDDLNIQFEIDNEDEDEILDELDELSSLDDDEDDDDDYSF